MTRAAASLGAFMLFALLAFGAVIILGPRPEITVPAPNLGNLHPQASIDWTLQSIGSQQAQSQIAMAVAATAASEWVAIEAFNGPAILDPDFCKLVSALTGQPCGWTAQVSHKDGKTIVDVQLWSGEHKLAHGQVMRIRLAEVDGVPSSLANQSEAWIGHIEVAKWLEGNGMGRIMWQATDTAARSVIQQTGGSSLRVLSDAAGWGPALMRSVPPQNVVFSNSQGGVWVYDMSYLPLP